MIDVISHAHPDILLMLQFDHDAEARALKAFQAALGTAGLTYPYFFTSAPNSGLPGGLDLDGDGTAHDARDAQGYGRFPGHGGMAVLSRAGPIRLIRDFTPLLWRDLPDATLPQQDGQPFPSRAAQDAQRLSSTAHWQLRVETPHGALDLLGFHATPPVFDGPEDRNGLRNADETRVWSLWLDGAFGPTPERFAILGGMNNDPSDAEGPKAALRALLADPRIQDPLPQSPGARAATQNQGGANRRHRGDPALDTADWSDAPGPGNLRVDYVLPSASLKVLDAGVLWPDAQADAQLSATVARASRHHLVWVDLQFQSQ